MEYSGAGKKQIHEKNQKQKISWHCPFKYKLKFKFLGNDLTSGLLSVCVDQFLTRNFMHASVPYAHAISSWCIRSEYASVPDPNAQSMHQFLTHMLSARIKVGACA